MVRQRLVKFPDKKLYEIHHNSYTISLSKNAATSLTFSPGKFTLPSPSLFPKYREKQGKRELEPMYRLNTAHDRFTALLKR